MVLRIALLTLVLGGLVAAYAADLHTFLRPSELRELIASSGLWGPLVYVALFALGEVVAVPSILFILAAGLTWPTVPALALAWVASIVSASVVFGLSRYVARDWVQRRLPPSARSLDALLERRGALGVALVRLVAFLAPWTHPALAVSRVTPRDYVAGTALGIIPGVVLLVLLGETVAAWFGAVPLWVWIAVAAVVALNLWNARRRRGAAS